MSANCNLLYSSYLLLVLALIGCTFVHLFIFYKTFASQRSQSSHLTISGRSYDVMHQGMLQYNFSDTKHEPDDQGHVNPHPFQFILTPRDSICGNAEHLFLLAYVHSAPQHRKRRTLIRRTWGKVSLYTIPVKMLFVMGLPSIQAPDNCQAAIEHESRIHGDIIQEDFIDTYRNLTLKAVAAMRWITMNCFHENNSMVAGPRYVLKTDDDAFVNMFAVLHYLQHGDNKVQKQATIAPPFANSTNATTRGSIMCSYHPKRLVTRSGKWKSTLTERRHPLWPPFCLGLAYLLTGSLVPVLYQTSFNVPFLWLDDVYVTGFLPLHIGREAVRHISLNSAYIGQVNLQQRIVELDARQGDGGNGRWQLSPATTRNSGKRSLTPMFSHVNNQQLFANVWKDLLAVEQRRQKIKDVALAPTYDLGLHVKLRNVSRAQNVAINRPT